HLKIFHIRCRDLIQGAEIGSAVIPADHGPVAGIRFAQHLIGHRYEVLDFTGHFETARRCRRRWSLCLTATLTATSAALCVAGLLSPALCRRRLRRNDECARYD